METIGYFLKRYREDMVRNKQKATSIEGQLRGLQRLIDSDTDCEKIAQQLTAARKALDKSFYSMVACMIEEGRTPVDQVTTMLVKFS